MTVETIAGYTLRQELGAGEHGTVYIADHERLEERAVIKVLSGGLVTDPERVARCCDDVGAAARLQHQGIIELLECGRDGETHYIATPYLEGGQSLAAALRVTGHFSDVRYALGIAAQIANALRAVHEAGIVHGDLKPSNVLLVDAAIGEPAVKLLDFGMHRFGPSAAHAYQAPELRGGDAEANALADIYALGALLFEMVSGQTPPAGDGRQASPLVGVTVPSMPGSVFEFVACCLSVDSRARPQSMQEVEERLVELQRTSNPVARTAVIAEPRTVADVPAAAFVPPVAVAATQVYEAKSAAARRSQPARAQESARPTPQPLPAERPRSTPVPAPNGAEEPRADVSAPRKGRFGRWAFAVMGIALGVVLLILAVGVFWAPEKNAEKVVASSDREPVRPASQVAALPLSSSGMVALAGGTFRMGSTSAEIDAVTQRCQQARSDWRRETFEREAPDREVKLDPFMLDRTEVSNENYARWLSSQEVEVDRSRLVRSAGVLLLDLDPRQGGIEQVPAGGFVPRAGRARKPVVQVTWFGAGRYCRDHGQELPTEAQWEFAARGATGRPFPWGEQVPTCGEVVFGRVPGAGCPGDSGPDEVGAAPGDTTPEGVHDLGGNVAEWVADAFVAPYPACGTDCHNPVQAGPEQGKVLRVIRGGDWREPAEACRAVGRTKGDQGSVRTNVGFRCSRSGSVRP